MRVLLWESSAYGRAGGRELRPNLHPGRPSLTSVAAESLLASLSLGFPIWTGTHLLVFESSGITCKAGLGTFLVIQR